MENEINRVSKGGIPKTLKNEAPSIHFNGRDGLEIMRLEPDGGIYVHGRLVENDKEVVDGLRKFLMDHKY